MSREWTILGLSPRMSQIFTCLSADEVTRHPFIWLLKSIPAIHHQSYGCVAPKEAKPLPTLNQAQVWNTGNSMHFLLRPPDNINEVSPHPRLLHHALGVWTLACQTLHLDSRRTHLLCWPGKEMHILHYSTKSCHVPVSACLLGVCFTVVKYRCR